MKVDSSILRGAVLARDDVRRLDQRVDHWARTTPDAAALTWRGTSVSYRELARASDTMAAGLTRSGVGRGDVVVVRIPRGPLLVQALLAVLKCGAVYAAVDPDWPEARRAQLVGRTRARWYLTDEPGGGAPGGATALDAAGLLAGVQDGPFTPAGGDFDDPCCVFLTSGSTGEPKAVAASHKAIVRIALDPVLGFGGGTRMPQTAPCPWDAFAMELWCPLAHGGTSMLHDGRHFSPQDVREAVAAGATTLFLTTALFNVVAETDPGAFAGLETLMVGGERATPGCFARCRAEHPDLRLLHVYGPVESCVYTTAYPVTGDDFEDGPGGDVPIGLPVTGTAVHLLDERLRPVPPGETGEIAVSGDGLSAGYVNDEEATRAAFVLLEPEDGDAAPVRVYLTGDLGRLDGDRGLVFAGRKDRQVKIRGVRVEPAEIEAVIGRVCGAAQVAVVPLPYGEPVKTHLAACVGGNLGEAELAGIRRALRDHLPAAFVPDRLFSVTELPLNANGKTDHAALAGLAARHRAERAARAATAAAGSGADAGAGGGAEADSVLVRDVTAMAQELLDVRLGPGDDIFELGGTSIMAIQLAHRLSRHASVKVNALEVMQAATPRAIAAAVEAAVAAAAGRESSGADARRARRSAKPSAERWLAGLPVPQWRFWYLEMMNPGTDDTRCPFEFRLNGPLDVAALAAALRTVVGRHEALRTRLVRVGARDVRADVVAARHVPDLLTVGAPCEERVAEWKVREFLARPFDLEADIPIRALVVPVGADEHILAISVHHTAFDGWSAGLLCRDLSDAYRAHAAGRAAPYRAPLRFADTWLDQDLGETERDRADLAAWGRRLVGVPDLPLVAEGELAPLGPVREVWIDVPDALRAAAERAAAPHGGTLQATLLAAWARALRRFTAADDFAVGIPVAGRTTPAAQDVIGCFASAVAVRFTGGHDTDPAADIAAAAEQLGQALRFQFTPMERLLREDAPRDRSRNPFCQAGFVVQNNVPPALEFDGVACAERRHQRTASSFEVTLELWCGTGLEVRLWYRGDVISAAGAQELAALWRAELETLAAAHAVAAR
ncbi:AMP-binding protein [Streptosporangium sandarakinum]|uniref:AMP-binding protein n=1 Tax=Streptosporangium sandarakinum TaxID=1260955 RepID=UPI0036CBC241